MRPVAPKASPSVSRAGRVLTHSSGHFQYSIGARAEHNSRRIARSRKRRPAHGAFAMAWGCGAWIALVGISRSGIQQGMRTQRERS